MKRIITFAASLASIAAFASPEVQGLTVSQNKDRMVTLSFTLTEKAIVTMDILTNGVSIGADNYQTLREPLSPKDVFPAGKPLAAGEHVWMWRPTKEWPGYHFDNNAFSVKVQAWSFDAPPDYMVVDGSSRSNLTFYASADEIPGGIKTADPTDAEAVSALSSDAYRTTKIIMRKIPAAGVKWRMGSPEDEPYRIANEIPHYVTLTNDYYVSIYPVTFHQSKVFFNLSEELMVKPKFNMAYTRARGSTTTDYIWLDDGHAVAASSPFAYMRGRTGIEIDFLTEAEWEYACRAGTEGRWNHDGDTPDEVAWTAYTGGGKDHVVGLKKPNRWGLYDMHGLVQEWVLDQYGPYPDGAVIAPEGVSTNVTKRILRGGPKAYRPTSSSSYNNSPKYATRSAYRALDTWDSRQDGNNNGYGVRLSCPAVLPDWVRQ